MYLHKEKPNRRNMQLNMYLRQKLEAVFLTWDFFWKSRYYCTVSVLSLNLWNPFLKNVKSAEYLQFCTVFFYLDVMTFTETVTTFLLLLFLAICYCIFLYVFRNETQHFSFQKVAMEKSENTTLIQFEKATTLLFVEGYL